MESSTAARVILPLGFAALLAACAQAPAASPAQTSTVASAAPSAANTSAPASAAGRPTAAIDREAVGVASALEQIRGHHQASLELYQAGDRSLAVAHATHPVAEIIASIKNDLTEAGAATTELEQSLQAVITAAEGDSEPALSSAVDAASSAVDRASAAVGGDAGTGSAYRASVIAALLATAGHEYSEAVSDGVVAEEIEYQDAYAFVQRARVLYDVIAPEVVAKEAAGAEEIEEAFATLATALPAVQPPTTVASVDSVETATGLIAHELAELAGALPVSEVDVDAQRAEIEELLDDLLALVETDQRDQAAELAADIYLEHYEVIEPQVIQAAPDINAELEPLLGAGLRAQINEGKSLEEIRASVERAKQLLGDAVEALEHS